MITTTEMYWLTRLDAIKQLLGCGFQGAFIILLIVLVVAAFATMCLGTFTGNGSFDMFSGRSDDELKTIHSGLRRTSWRCAGFSVVMFVLSMGCCLLDAFLPSTREMAAIIMVPAVVNNEKVQTVGNKLYELAVEWMEELRPPKKEGK